MPTIRRAAAVLVAVLTALTGLVTVAASPSAAAEVAPDAQTAVRSIVFPVDGPHHYSDTFGACRSGCARGHEGTDIMTAKLTPLVAARDATVTLLKDTATPDGKHGNYLKLQDDQGWRYFYVHINNDSPGTDDGANPKEWIFAPGIRLGSKVKAGQHIAYAGDSGNAEQTAPHLHFEIHKPDGSVINPYKSLQQATPPGGPVCEGTPAGRYIDGVHQLFVERPATADEVQRWCRDVTAGNRGRLTNALSVSDEWAGARLTDLYQTIIQRGTDPTGYKHWMTKIAQGHTLRQIAIGIYGSPEYFEKNGGTDQGYVQSLYARILGRTADPSGLAHWLRHLETGTKGRTGVANGFYQSIESRQQRVTDLYRLILGRSPDPTGMQTWTKQLVTVGDVRLAATLATSQEFYNRVT